MKYKKNLILKLKKDVILGSYWISKFINKLLRHGLKFISEKLFYTILKESKKQKLNFFFLFMESIEYIRPSIIFIKVSRKKSKPLVLNLLGQYTLAIHWLFLSVLQRSEKTLTTKFLVELQSIVFKRRSVALNYKKNIETKLYEHYISLLE